MYGGGVWVSGLCLRVESKPMRGVGAGRVWVLACGCVGLGAVLILCGGVS